MLIGGNIQQVMSTGFVVKIYNRHFGNIRLTGAVHQVAKQHGFGVAIALPRTMKIEVFVLDVGDNRNVKITGSDTMLGQPVRSGFQNTVGQAGLDHPGEVALHCRRGG